MTILTDFTGFITKHKAELDDLDMLKQSKDFEMDLLYSFHQIERPADKVEYPTIWNKRETGVK